MTTALRAFYTLASLSEVLNIVQALGGVIKVGVVNSRDGINKNGWKKLLTIKAQTRVGDEI
jgi:hypothetical protein